MERETVGKLSAELLQKEERPDHSAFEQMQEQLTGFEDHVHATVDSGKAAYAGDFYVVVVTKRERLMQNVLRNYFFTRISCPTPEWDQTVYKYHRKDERLEFLWVVPSKHACADLIANKLDIDLSLSQLLKFVLDFEDGTLDNLARTLNNEPIIKKELVYDGRASSTPVSHAGYSSPSS